MKCLAVGDIFVTTEMMRSAFEKYEDLFTECKYLFFGKKNRKAMRDTVKLIELGGRDECALPKGYLEAVEEAEVLMVHLCPITEEVLNRAKKLKYILCNRGGVENVDVEAVNAFIQELKSRNLYTIARISAFRDRSYGMEHVNRGIYHVSKMGLWPDSQHCYWLDPTNSTVLSYVTSVVQEVKAMGFDEIVLADFKIPSSDKALFNGDKNQALTSAAAALAENCGTEQVILSFVVDSSSFQLPEGQCRLYLDTVAAERVGAAAALTTVENPKVYMVFIADSNDTRYDEYSVLRPIAASDVLGSGNRE